MIILVKAFFAGLIWNKLLFMDEFLLLSLFSAYVNVTRFWVHYN